MSAAYPVPVVVTCGDTARERWSPWLDELGADVVALPEAPGRAEIDPLLPEASPGARMVVAGDDAALAAVLVRLLRRERLDVALAVLPTATSPAASVWGLPVDPAAAVALARDGVATAVPLIRDDRGGLIAGRHEIGPFHGAVYCDEHLVAHGDAEGMVVCPDPQHGVAVAVTGPRRLGGLRPGRVATYAGRAVQIGCRGASAWRDGVPDDRPVPRRSWYRHTEDWHLVTTVTTVTAMTAVSAAAPAPPTPR